MESKIKSSVTVDEAELVQENNLDNTVISFHALNDRYSSNDLLLNPKLHRTSICQSHPRISTFVCTFIFCTLPFIIVIGVIASQHLLSIVNVKNVYGINRVNEFASFSRIGVVAADVTECSQLGVKILRNGGKAMDASVTVSLCLGTMSPASSGLGGGAYILTHDSTTGVNEFIDSRETGPAGSTSKMFFNRSSRTGGLAVGTIAELKGLYIAWQRHGGNIAWKDLVMPVAELAKRVKISANLAFQIKASESYIRSKEYPELSRLLLNSDDSIKVEGQFIERPELSMTLTKVSQCY